jgi:hypothetical protein
VRKINNVKQGLASNLMLAFNFEFKGGTLVSVNKKQDVIVISVAAALIIFFIALGTILNFEKKPEELTTEEASIIFEEPSSETIEEESSESVVITEQAPVKKPTESVTSSTNANTYFDVPLSTDLQDHIFSLCEKYEVSPALVIAMIEQESTYDPKAVNYNETCFGLMQVYEYHHTPRMNRLGVTDLFDPYQNVTVGIDILAELYATGKSTEWVLMAYNGGNYYADAKISTGKISNYARSIMDKVNSLGG